MATLKLFKTKICFLDTYLKFLITEKCHCNATIRFKLYTFLDKDKETQEFPDSL